MGTVVGAALTDDGFDDGGAAAVAGFTFAPDDAEVFLEFATLPVDALVGGVKAGAADVDRFGKDARRMAIRLAHFVRGEARGITQGMNFRVPERFVGVDVATPARKVWLSKRRFDMPAPRP